MKIIKKNILKKVLSLLIIFTMIFSQKNMLVFADIVGKNVVNLSTNKLANKNDGEEDKSDKNDDKNYSNRTSSDFSSKVNSSEKELNKEYKMKNESIDNSIELGDLKAGSYTITQEGIYPFTGDWGEEYILESKKAKKIENMLRKGVSTYENTKEKYYYGQLDIYKQAAYDLYTYVLEHVEQNQYLDIAKYDLYITDFYGVFSAVIHENPQFFFGRDMNLDVNDEGLVTRIKYSTPFTQEELDEMKEKFKQGYEKAINEIRLNLGENPTKLETVTKIHDYLVSNNHYGKMPCPEETHPDKPCHAGCKGIFVQQSAYGALVKSEKYGVVCEGFASAFVLLCDYFKVDCLYDAGWNVDGDLHAWNYVEMEDKNWYLVDLTYDNEITVKQGISYDFFLTGMENPNFEFRHDKYLGCYYNTTCSHQEYTIPEISEKSYIKFEVTYPKGSQVSRKVFINFTSLLDDLKKRDLAGNHIIKLKDNYTLNEEEVQNLKDYKTTNKQKFFIKAELEHKDIYYTLKSQINEIYFPMSTYLEDITYDIKSTYIGGSNLLVSKNVRNGLNECSIYLLGKGDNINSNEVYITSGHWKDVACACSNEKYGGLSTHSGDIFVTIEGSSIDNLILSQGSTIKGNVDVEISRNADINNFKYGNDIRLGKDKNLRVDISSGAIVNKFESNNNPISANLTIDVAYATVETLVGPNVFDSENNCTTTINVVDGHVNNIVGSDNSGCSNPKTKNSIFININNTSETIKSIKGSSSEGSVVTININENTIVETLTDFNSLAIGKGKTLNVTNELNYKKTDVKREGMVELNGNSTLKLPKTISTVGSLSSIGKSNRIMISKEDACLSINENQGTQGTPIIINYDEGLVPQNGDELIRYKNLDDIHLNNFINEVSERFQLYDDETTFSIRLFLSYYPIKVKYNDGESYEFSSLYDALDYIERQVDDKKDEVSICINENYNMTKEDLDKLQNYSSSMSDQKLIFTSENKRAVLSSSSDIILPTKKLESIEFKDITLDLENKNIFAAGKYLVIGESVKMTSRSNINLYGGLPGKKVTRSKLILNGGTFNDVYGCGLLPNGTVSKNITISLNKGVLVKGSVYGGSGCNTTELGQTPGTTTINLLGGTVLGDIVGGCENNLYPTINNIVINYGNSSNNNATVVSNIYGLTRNLTPGLATNNITINVNKDAKFDILAGFSNLNVSLGVALSISNILKYDSGITSSSEGKVKLSSGSNLCIPNNDNEENRKIGKLDAEGLNSIYIAKGHYLLINSNSDPVVGNPINIFYYSGLPELNDNLVKFSNKLLASNTNFKTDYHFDISASIETGFLYLSEKTYRISLYDDNGLSEITEVFENESYTFKKPEKTKGNKFVKWEGIDEEYQEGQTITVTKDISVKAVYEHVNDCTVTLKVNGVPYKEVYVEEGKSYTFEAAPQIPEKYFIGWEKENGPSNNLYCLSRSMINNVSYIQPGTTIVVNNDSTYDAEYGDEVDYEVDYGDGNGKVQNVYYAGGTIDVSSTPPPGIKIPFGKIFGGFKVIFGGIGNIIGGIGNVVSVLFRPGDSITIQPGVRFEAVWVNEDTIKICDECGKLTETKKIGEGFSYTIPEAPEIEYKELLYWQDTLHPNNRYSENQSIVVSSDMNLKPIYKNLKVVSLTLDTDQPKYFPDFSEALNYASKYQLSKFINIEFLENYSLTDKDIDTLMNFKNKNNSSFIITGCTKAIKLKISASIRLSGDTEFKDITLDYGNTTGHGIYARGHKLEMGQNIEMKGTGSPILIGGENKKNVTNSEIIVRSGRYSAIYGGGYLEYSGVNGNITIELDGGEVCGDIYAGSQSSGLISCGTTNINLLGGTVGGVVSGSSRLLELENSNDVNIKLAGTKLKKGEVYGGYVEDTEDSHNTGEKIITVEQSCPLNKLVGFTKLDIKQNRTLTVNEALNHQGGVEKTTNGGEISLNGNSKLIVPSSGNASDRQAGWLDSNGENNEIRVGKNKYLTLTSKKDDSKTSNQITLSLKEEQTSKDIAVLLKYENNKEKADVAKFKKGQNIQNELVLKDDEDSGCVYADERDLVSIIKQGEKTHGFKTIKGAIKKVQSDSQKGTYTVRLLDDYTLTEADVNELSSFNRSGVSFVIDGLTENDKPNAMLNISNDIMLSTDTTFENISFKYNTSDTHGIYARGHRLEMGEGIAMKGLRAPILFGGENKKDVKKSEIIVKSGTYSAIYGGGSSEYSGVKGDIRIELHNGTVTGDIYAGSQDTGLISTGTTNIKLAGGSVSGIVSGTSKLLNLENSNNVNIYLQGTELNKVYGGYVEDKEDYDDTGVTTVFVEKTCTLNSLVGFTKLDIEQGVTLDVTDVLNHEGGVRVTEDNGQICLNGQSKLIVPSSYNVSDRQVGWLKSNGQDNEIIVDRENEYLSLTSKKDDEIDGNKIILNLKENKTSEEPSILLKYENSKEKANIANFKKENNIQSELVLKEYEESGCIYADGKDFIKITKPHQESMEFKTIKDAIKKVQSDSQEGTYTITLLENYTLTESDIDELSCFNRPNVDFVISGLNENTDLREELKINNNIMLSTDTEFKNIVLDYETTNGNEIYARGHKLEMGENITVEGISCPILFGGENGKNVKHSEIIVKSGTYSGIYGGGSSEYSGVEGNITIELDDGHVLGDIYAGSENMGLTCGGKTEMILFGGTVDGVVSGTSKLLGLENSNNVNIQLQGTELNELYGGYVENGKDYDNTGITTVTVGETCTLKDLVGFTKLDIQPEVVLTVTDVLNYEGGVSLVGDRAQINLNRNAELIDPAKYNTLNRKI